MTPFTFNTTRSIISGPGKAAEIGGIARPLLGERVLLVTDSGLLRAGLLEPALASLRTAGCAIRIFNEVKKLELTDSCRFLIQAMPPKP